MQRNSIKVKQKAHFFDGWKVEEALPVWTFFDGLSEWQKWGYGAHDEYIYILNM